MSVSQINRSTRLYDIPNSTTTPYPTPKRTVCHMQKNGSYLTQPEAVYAKMKHAVQGGLVSGRKVGAKSTIVNLMSGKGIFKPEVSKEILYASGSFALAKTVRNLARAATEDVEGGTAIRAAVGATANAVRKAYLGEGAIGIALGSAAGAAYELLADAEEALKEQGYTDLSKAAGVAGTYAIELGAAAVLCYTNPLVPCPVHVAKAAVAATILVVA